MSKNKYSDLKNPRLTFGCLLGDVDEEYQKKICSGISNFCKINDINLIYYAGRPLEIPNKFEAQCNVIFDLISPDIIDGLIILTGTIGNYIGHKRFLKFLQKYRDLPCVSVSMKIKNMP
ncbi:MAG: hypothetical protein KGD57_05710, partial [Candidatus Lokiarchaeota archaeon]|nr:hypothetical protein [Candidatus Lokiarchaeota archaeon]